MVVFRYGSGILHGTLNPKRNGTLNPKRNVGGWYKKIKEVGRGLMSLECCVRKEENSLGFYVANSKENFIKGVAAAKTINAEDTVRY